MPSANRGLRSRRNNTTPVVGTWDYDGSCRPRPDRTFYNGQETFSVGCFQWVQLSGKKKTTQVKRGKTVKRISGSVNHADEVYAKAEAYCQSREASE